MKEDQYILYQDRRGRFLLQNIDNGILAGLMFPALPGESARAFSYDYGSIWYPRQIINFSDFPELADIPFFTIESCAYYQIDSYFKDPNCVELYPLLGTYSKWITYALNFSIKTNPSPTLWSYKFPNPNGSWTMPILDLIINQEGCFFSNREGWIVGINHYGQPMQQYYLPQLSRCLLMINETLYAACDDGKIYELGDKLPQVMTDLRSLNPYRYSFQFIGFQSSENLRWLVDAYGNLMSFNESWEQQGQPLEKIGWLSYLLCCDDQVIYQGYYQGVNCFSQLQGDLLWKLETSAPVLCGTLRKNDLIIGCADYVIYTVSLADNHQLSPLFICEGMPYCIIIHPQDQRIFIADNYYSIYVLSEQGILENTLVLEQGIGMTMKIWGERLYVGTNEGSILCFDI